MTILDELAPRLSTRRLLLSFLRDFIRQPSSIFGRLSPINFHNHRLCRGRTMICNVCGDHAQMLYEFPDVNRRRAHHIGLLRETLSCERCGSTMRMRQLAHALLEFINARCGQRCDSILGLRETGVNGLRILDTDSFSVITRMLRGMPGYVSSQFVPSRRNGELLADGSIMVDLQRMPFENGSFDIILTSDVMEHVPDDAASHAEIARCIAPRGAYIFTVPFDPRFAGRQQLTQPTGDGNWFVLDEHIHGDPHSSSGIVAHRIYGWHLLKELDALGYSTRFDSVNRPAAGIFGGDVFTAVRNDSAT